MRAAWRRWGRSERLRFIAVGVYNTAFGYASFALLYLAIGPYLNWSLLLAIAHCLSVTNAFIAHRRMTFRSSARWWPEYLRFHASYLSILGFNLLALSALVKGAGIPPLPAAALVMGATMCLSYVLHRKFSFRPDVRS
ncbi:MAG: hypothetical protein NVSMB10_01020 [Steroidobacteraceae bacterium]